MSGTAGKVVLLNTTTAVATGVICPSGATVVDIVGYGTGTNCFEGTGPTAPLNNTTAALRAGNGSIDTDNNNTDFTTGTPNPRNSSFSAQPTATATNTVVPTDTATPSATATATDTATPVATPTDTATPEPGVTVTPAPTNTATATPTDTATPAPTNTATATSTPAAACSTADVTIGSVQGTSDTAAANGQTVTVQGVVVLDYEGASPALRGFYLQDAGDGNAATSDGIFVFEGDNANRVSVGQVVEVTGPVSENQGQTQVSSTTSIQVCGTSATVLPTDVTLPFASTTAAEAYEGMLVRFTQTLFVTEHFQLGRFGQVVMSSGGRLYQPTNVTTPGAAANALQLQNNLNRIIVDDATQAQNPDPIVFGRGGQPLSASNTLRGGDTATGMVGVMTYTWGGNAASPNAYRLRPIGALGGGAPDFQPANPRPAAAPAVGGSLRAVGMNLLNFFNTFGTTACKGGTTGAVMECRGADDAGEFARQWPKTVAAIKALNADVVGINEIENDGYGSSSAIQFLVDKLNADLGAGTYAFINVDAATGQVDAMGSDAIKVGMLYKPAKVTPVGTTAVLNSVAFVNGGDSAPRSRPSLAQAFEENATGARFILDVNHLKSKGSACATPDAGDGQGNCNVVRKNAATELVNWLASNPTGTGDPDILLVGDYNSYAMEDPITIIKNAGYTNLIATRLGEEAYSYVFDGQWGYLDHALGSSTLTGQVAGVGDYHINADEPSVLDYNDDFKTPGQITSLYNEDQYRVSDHDPVIVGLNLTAPSAPTATPTSTATATVVPTATSTSVPPTATATVVPTATSTSVPPTATATVVPTATSTSVPPTATATVVPTATSTPIPPTATATVAPTATSTAVPTATPANRAPVAVADSATVRTGKSVTIPVLANDTDADGDTLRVLSVRAPQHGTVTITSTGSVIYTPTKKYVGPDTFTYVVTDNKGGYATGTVTITVTK